MLNILYDIIFSPRLGFRKIIKRNSYFDPFVLVFIVGAMNGLAIATQRNQPLIVSVLYSLMLLLFWFTQSAFLNLMGELVGGERGGKELLTSVAYTIFPLLFLTPFHLQSETAFAISLIVIFGWSVWLTILALESAQKISVKKAAFAVLIPYAIYVLLSYTGGLFSSLGL